ncbi:RNA polymerase II C-terminal domain phosphatase-like 3 [Nicotiana tabacum]|uniref:protein-serine/threonine phosphatase n=1 Tax=Nicotiana tabacum TaxID=4097 RepID=A0A1S4BUS5_TOBAC|nr:PREDICTED: RNA polymerase II C-terminal domain phosphatase-like 3 [Nicotiana tabacum]XP_016492579.1 PREDICTED: RNA polymerase II C-terminal domain phosphatase-like 3 [Nicotiana tabacum]
MEECNTPAVGDVEEGEISDSASVEEISEDAFNKQQDPPTSTTVTTTATTKVVNSNNQNQNSSTRVWTMKDIYKYPISRDYARGLYNLAWAQAVQNKPLNELFVMTTDDNSKQSVESSSDMVEKVIIHVDDDTMEEGELEEGEIDSDADVVVVNGGATNNDDELNSFKTSKEEANLIREQLLSVTVDEMEKSFPVVCSKLQNSLDSVGELAASPDSDDLVQLFMTAIQIVNSVFCSMNQNQKEQNREILSRLLLHVKSQVPALLSSEQLKEVDAVILSINQSAVSSITEDNDQDNVIKVVKVLDMNDSHSSSENANQDCTSVKKCDLDVESTKSSGPKEQNVSFEYIKPGLANSKARGLSVPLLDLHKDHDIDTLPSPTREIAPIFPIAKASTQTHGVVKPELPMFTGALEKGSSLLHPYETDALKAVSSYQQKFGRSSLFDSEKFPSPTPSNEGDSGEGDTGGEVSSSNVGHNASVLNASSTWQPIVSSVPPTNILAGQGLGTARNADPLSFLPNPSLRSSTAKSRDPRLRLATSEAAAQNLTKKMLPIPNIDLKLEASLEMIGSRKQKIVEQPAFDAPLLKRQRSEQTDSIIVSDVRPSTGNGGWLEHRGTVGLPITSSNYVTDSSDNDTRKLEQVTSSVSTSNTIPSVIVNADVNLPLTGTSANLHSLLKDIAINPSIWMNIIKLEQQKSADASKTTTVASSSSSILGAVPSTNVAAPKSSVIGQRSVGIIQTPTQTTAADEVAKVRMKPRDPRRVLHNTAVQKSGNSGSADQCKTGVAGTQAMISSHCVQRPEDQLDRKSAVIPSTTPPDIARQFTKNLKNIADMISVSPTSTSPSAASQTPAQHMQVHPSRLEGNGAVSESSELLTDAGLASGKAPPGSLQLQSSWGNVEHLFEGYSDQQRASIQRERTRRLEEQKKMFSVRKLCLVLDLDHTLLNSAKFVEIDPVHQEILRKKEEQDREKPYKHLFRFPHMGMWTKLRPGIWNFLEKASKLFELHLYTMGNKLYATEMAKLLDPKGDLFAGRVISRGDDGDPLDGDERIPKSKDLEGVLGMESAVVIIDDSVRVWPHNKLNLIVVERYIYFPCSRRQFGLPGPSLLEIDHDERPEDGTLASCLGVIQRIHQNFFEHRSIDEADVRNILATEQQKILAGCRIVFSRVFPVGEANPHFHPLWQTAEQFGAVCSGQIDEQVTHVVANSLGTDKVNWALSTGRFVVHPGWVEASALLYRRANEHDFAIKP